MRRVRGDRAFKRLIKQLPAAVRQEILAVMQSQGRDELSKEQSLVARRTGALGAGLTMRVLPVSLKLKVGLLGKPINRKLYYGWIVEKGRKAQTVIVVRQANRAAAKAAAPFLGGTSTYYKYVAHKHGLAGTYQLRVGALPPRHFVYTSTREQLYQPYRVVWNNALARAATGVSDA